MCRCVVGAAMMLSGSEGGDGRESTGVALPGQECIGVRFK